ncbi:hypothetical protein ABB26_00080 [Stenotrophomonas humi]|uniref:Uncharacterized protein n=1 Tax=Stenotrophomonas humi TaxID=405444 RepID=A0A0R0CA72_9GAMM|nr:hypothetical protein ABB26_00080 [Stenotrophomonas humi]
MQQRTTAFPFPLTQRAAADAQHSDSPARRHLRGPACRLWQRQACRRTAHRRGQHEQATACAVSRWFDHRLGAPPWR